MDYSVTDLSRALLTLDPCSIAVYPVKSPDYLRWDFSYPSGLRVTVVLSVSQSRTMAIGIERTSGQVTRHAIGYGTQLRFFGDVD